MAGILDGITVLDLTRNVAGPFCTMTLGDLGARVIKVERPGSGDDTRDWHPPSWNGYSATFLALNRNKESLAVDIDQPEGQEIVRRLAVKADVVVESFRAGSLEKRGLAYEQIRELNPRVIYCSISGFGSRGPYRDRPGYDPLIQAYSGVMSVTGEPGRPPVRVGPSLIDMGTGMWCALGIVSALYERERTGRGRLVENSLLETGLVWVCYHLAGYFGTGKVPGRGGSRAAMIAPYEAFATRDDYLMIAAPNDRIFARLCEALGVPELSTDPRFATNPDRIAHRDELHELLEARLKERTAAEWEALLLERQVPCSRVQGMDQVATDPQVLALDIVRPFPHPKIPDLRLVDLPLSFDGERSARQDPPPELGEHTDRILGELGYDAAAIGRLREQGVVG
ncbi:MAG TPA: CoA transferase [Bacillota bacterium]